MKSNTFYCPYNSVFSLLQKIVVKKGYVVSLSDIHEGRIKSYNENGLFKKLKMLDIKIFRMDERTTGMTLMVNANVTVFENPFSANDYEEERINNAISTFF